MTVETDKPSVLPLKSKRKAEKWAPATSVNVFYRRFGNPYVVNVEFRFEFEFSGCSRGIGGVQEQMPQRKPREKEMDGSSAPCQILRRQAFYGLLVDGKFCRGRAWSDVASDVSPV